MSAAKRNYESSTLSEASVETEVGNEDGMDLEEEGKEFMAPARKKRKGLDGTAAVHIYGSQSEDTEVASGQLLESDSSTVVGHLANVDPFRSLELHTLKSLVPNTRLLVGRSEYCSDARLLAPFCSVIGKETWCLSLESVRSVPLFSSRG